LAVEFLEGGHSENGKESCKIPSEQAGRKKARTVFISHASYKEHQAKPKLNFSSCYADRKKNTHQNIPLVTM
jgi:hypothetical protein